MPIVLTQADQQRFNELKLSLERVLAEAEQRPALARKIFALAARHRNRGRQAAIRSHAFKGVCEISGLPIARTDAALDELDPTLGYAGPVRWVCQRANGDGRATCGQC